MSVIFRNMPERTTMVALHFKLTGSVFLPSHFEPSARISVARAKFDQATQESSPINSIFHRTPKPRTLNSKP